MTKILRSVGISAALAVASFMSAEAGAMPVGGSGKAALEQIGVVTQAQYTWGGSDYCWYDDGWNGPGYYICGQYTVRGVGWGGAAGWHGWARGGGRGGHVAGRTGGGRVGSVGRTGGGRTGSVGGRTGGGRTGGHVSGRTGGGHVSGRTGGGGRTGAGGRTGGGRTGGGGRGGGGRRSDMLLKHDVALLGHLENGLGFYRFSYDGSDKAYVGVIAQEVQQSVPQAVARGSDGYLRVRYDMVGVKFQSYEQWLAAGAIVPAGLPVRH
jgi:hypothetical protein